MGSTKPIPVSSDKDHQGNEILNAVIVSPVINGGVTGNAVDILSTGGIPVNLSVCEDDKFASTKAVRAAILESGGQTVKPNGLIWYNVVWSGTGLTFYVSAKYIFNSIEFLILNQPITLSAADSILNRIDVIYVDDAGLYGAIEGTLNANPSKPSIDPFTQIELTFVYIEAGSLVPVEITQVVIYDENIEWTGQNLNLNTTIDFANTSSPFRGTKCMRVSEATTPLELVFNFSTVTPVIIEGGQLIFRIKLVLTSDSLNELAIAIGNDALSSMLVIPRNNSWGLDYSSIVWQTVVIPFSTFINSPSTINIVGFKGIIEGGTVAYFDAIELQVGNNIPVENIMITGAITGQGSNIISTNFIDDISFEYKDLTPGVTQIYTLDIKASYRYKIIGLVLVTNDGTLTTVGLYNTTHDTTILHNVLVNTNIVENTITANNEVNAGDLIVLITGTGFTDSPTDLIGKLIIYRY